MSDITPILDLIDGAIGDHLSNDAMRWTPKPADAQPVAYCPPRPHCGRPVETITRGRTYERGPSQPITYGPCGCQPGAHQVWTSYTPGLSSPVRVWLGEVEVTQYFVGPVIVQPIEES